MRGKDVASPTVAGVSRITPAYAGKSGREPQGRNAAQDHPRLCGEKHGDFRTRERRTGSPPPMRGKAAPSVADLKSVRITPAYAGKSDFGKVGGSMAEGSPPPMRGKGNFSTFRSFCTGITPAYAGKSYLQHHQRSEK